MSFAIAYSRCIHGSEALEIRVETHLGRGLPAFTIVGLPETAVRESRDRVRSALANSGFEFPQRRITVNLAPGDVPKEGTRFDLAIAIGILAASGQLPRAALADLELVAELALDGCLRPVRATFASALGTALAGRELVVASADADAASLVEEATVRGAGSLVEVVHHLAGSTALPRHLPPAAIGTTGIPDLADVLGQARARRALEVAASGGHNLLLIGPPGTGKSMLARRLPGLLPPLASREALASAALRSIAGLAIEPARWRERPFRAPHHGCSAAALIGGGRLPRPGEISLAHHGVLFLDELPEFDRRALEALREPLEQGQVTVARAHATVSFPARFQLVAAMNPCPCGYDGDPKIECRCTPDRIARYRARVSGPLVDRIDMHVEVPRQRIDLVNGDAPPAESSGEVAARVARCQALQHGRQGCLNTQLEVADIARHCVATDAGRRLLGTAIERLALGARSYHRVLKLARTIADLAMEEMISETHVAEAVGYRAFDRNRISGT